MKTINEYKKEGYVVKHDKCLPESSPQCILPDIIKDWQVGTECPFDSTKTGKAQCFGVRDGNCTGNLIVHLDGVGEVHDTYCGRHHLFVKE